MTARGLKVSGVRHRFGDRLVLQDAALTVAPGELVCLLGPSGCGKSTLLRLCAGLEDLQEGLIEIDGRPVAGGGLQTPPEKRNVGLVFQDYALFPHLSVLDNVRFGASDRKRALDLLERLGLAGHARSYPHMLSGGQQQRVALARALAPAPAVLLLDEPFSGLDVTLRAQVREEMADILKETGVAVVMVTHDPEEAMFMADRIQVMGTEGLTLQVGTPEEIYFRPIDRFVARFLGPLVQLPAKVRDGRAETALGSVPAPNRPEGDSVDVLIRHEGLRLVPEGGVPVRIEAARLLGSMTHTHIRPLAPDGSDTIFECLVPVGFPARPGDEVGLVLDQRLAFVFGAAP